MSTGDYNTDTILINFMWFENIIQWIFYKYMYWKRVNESTLSVTEMRISHLFWIDLFSCVKDRSWSVWSRFFRVAINTESMICNKDKRTKIRKIRTKSVQYRVLCFQLSRYSDRYYRGRRPFLPLRSLCYRYLKSICYWQSQE